MIKILVVAIAFWIFLLSSQVMQANTIDAEKLNGLEVSTIENEGAGSLRQAILDANASAGPDIITFSQKVFERPQVISVSKELPLLKGEIIIDGYIPGQLWNDSGVTLAGTDKHSIFYVPYNSTVTIKHLTIAEGRAENGGGIVNKGILFVNGVTFIGNKAEKDGGAILNLGGTLKIINSTFSGNSAALRGGGLAILGGTATVTNSTFSENGAALGGDLFNAAHLLLNNTILANSIRGGDCASLGAFDPASKRNLIEINLDCGTPINSEDPRLEPLGYFNGPVKTYPLGGGSPAVNLGDNDSAVDEYGEPLIWDQRGNGDPRFVAGFTDIGAFERQSNAVLTVDTSQDTMLRACTQAGPEDCPLRGAIEIANALGKTAVISFDPKIFSNPQIISLTRPLPEPIVELTLDARKGATVTIKSPGKFPVFSASPGLTVLLENVLLK